MVFPQLFPNSFNDITSSLYRFGFAGIAPQILPIPPPPGYSLTFEFGLIKSFYCDTNRLIPCFFLFPFFFQHCCLPRSASKFPVAVHPFIVALPFGRRPLIPSFLPVPFPPFPPSPPLLVRKLPVQPPRIFCGHPPANPTFEIRAKLDP